MVTGEAGAVLTGHAAAVRAVAVASGAGTLVSASEDKSVRLWGLGTWECFRVLQARFLPSSPYSCAPLPVQSLLFKLLQSVESNDSSHTSHTLNIFSEPLTQPELLFHECILQICFYLFYLNLLHK